MLIALALLGVVAARALAASGDDFPAREQPLRGTPVVLLVQDGVSRADVRAVAAGLRRADRFIRVALGRKVRGPVSARIARGDPCPGADGDRSVIGQGGEGGLCIDTANLQWQWLIRNHPRAATAIPAHEYVHVLQSQLGCLGDGQEREHRWIVEGTAGHVGWQALAWSGAAPDAEVRRWIRRDGAFDDPSLRPLRAYETQSGRTPQYARWHLAVRHLLAATARRGTASTSRPESALLRFCALVGAGRPWRSAFLAGFGVSVFGFYARFETVVRRTG